MYLFLPPLFLLLPRVRSTAALLTIWGLSLVVAMLQPMVSGRLNIVAYVPFFFPGVIAYAMMGKSRRDIPAWAWPVWLFGIALAVSTVDSMATERLMALVLSLSIPLFRELCWMPARKAAAWIAKYSYGIYLFHVICIWFAFQYLSGLPKTAQWGIFLLLVALVPVASYHLLEEPMVRIGGRLADKWFGFEHENRLSASEDSGAAQLARP